MGMMRRVLEGRRQVQSLISRETIKPSSPTPSHLQTYHLSLFDQICPRVRIPVVYFYANSTSSSSLSKSNQLKKSLSHTLSKYHPFSGRFPTPTTPYVECNDEGVMFSETRHESTLDTFINNKKLQNEETLDQLFPDDHDNSPSLLEVQINHFSCGGLAVAASMAHKIGDGSTLGTFMNHWATVARYGSVDHEQVTPINPFFISHPKTTINVVLPIVLNENKNVTIKKFVFPNSKLNVLKNKVSATASANTTNPTRVEVLTSLLFKCERAAAEENCGFSKPSGLVFPVNLRKKLVQPLPDTTVGNIGLAVIATILQNRREITFDDVISELRKGRKQLEGIKDVEECGERLKEILSQLGSEGLNNSLSDFYKFSSVCGFPLYKADFGWGKPIRVTYRVDSEHKNFNLLMDTPSGDGIEALVTLEEEDMAIFQNDKELLEFC